MIPDLLANWPAGVGAWVIASIALYVTGSWGGWLLRRSPSGAELQWSSWGYATRWLLRLAHLAGIPYLTLLLGVTSPRLFGLSDMDWLLGLGIGGGMALVGLAVWLAGCWTYRHLVPRVYDGDEPPAVLYLLEAIALQFHWAFYRSLTLRWLDDAYWGVWASLLLIGLEAALGAGLWRRGWTQARLERWVSNAVLLLATTALFFYTRNLWLCIVFHAVAALLLTHGLAGTRARPAPWTLRDGLG